MDDRRDHRHEQSLVSRRRFVVGAAAILSSVPIGTLLSACGGDSDTPATNVPTAAGSTGSGTGAGAGATAPASGAGGAAATATRAPSGSPSTGGTTSGSAGTPKRGGTLIQVIDSDPPTINMAITSGVSDQTVASKIQQGLLTLDDKFELKPELAEKWQISDDALQYTFTLQKGVKWSDGQPMTSADVKFTMMDVVAKFHPISASTFQRITAIDTPDELTAVIKFTDPYGPFMTSLEPSLCPIIPKHIFEGKDVLKDPHSLTEPIGTGPFLLTDWKRGESLTLDRNPNYWEQGKPYLDRIILKLIPQASARTAAIKTGEVNYLLDYMLDKADWADLKKDTKLQTTTGLGAPSNNLCILNVRNKPLDDKRVRQALYTALDRQFIIDTIFFGLGDVSKSSITPQLAWAYNPKIDLSKQYAFDPQKANKMLDDAGYAKGSGGRRFSVKLVFDSARPGWQQFGEIVRANWGDIGVEVNLNPVERQVMIDQVFAKWDFDATLQGYTTSGDPAVGIARLYVTSSIGQRPFTNASGYSNPEVDDQFDKGAKQATNEKRAPFYYRVQEILAEDVPSLVINDSLTADVATNNFEFASTIWSQAYANYGWEEVWQKS